MLADTQAKVTTERSSKKAPLSDDDARALLAAVDTVVIARGKSAETKAAAEATLDDLKGPTGGYRAPILLHGKRLLVGFNEEALRSLL